MTPPDGCRAELLDGVLEIALCRPQARNALDYATVRALVEHLHRAHADPAVGSVLLYGEGACFSSGGDLAEFRRDVGQSARDYHVTGAAWAELMTAIPGIDVPVVVAAHRHALAGATGIVAACDIAIAADDAVLGLPELQIGLFPAIVFGTVAAAVGTRRARELALSARRIDAEEALRIGLVHRVVAADGMLSQARGVATSIARHGREATRLGKRFIRHVDRLDVPAATGHGQAIRGAFMDTEDFRAGLARFLSDA